MWNGSSSKFQGGFATFLHTKINGQICFSHKYRGLFTRPTLVLLNPLKEPAWMQLWKSEKKKLLPHEEKKRKKCLRFPCVAIDLIWFKLCIKSPQGSQPTCSPYPFVQPGTRDNRKRLELGVPWGPNFASSFYFFIPSFPLTLCTPLFSTYFFFFSALSFLCLLKSLSSSYTTS